MRLTNITQVSLDPGRLRSYAVRATVPTGARFPVSLDQGRHIGEGDRPGSWMALAFRLPGPADYDDLARAWRAVVARHGTLRTVFSNESAEKNVTAVPVAVEHLRLSEYEIEDAGWKDHDIPPGQVARDVIRALFDDECRPFGRPSYRLVLLESEAGPPQVVIGSDHSHVDMWSMLVLARDLVAGLEDLINGREPCSGLPPVPSFAEHTAQLQVAPPAPDAVHHRWAEILEAEGGDMPVFPLDLGDLSRPVAAVVEVRDILDAGELDRFTAVATSQNARLLPFTMSVLTEATRRVSGKSLRVVFPVHSRYEPQWHDSVGWYITNSVLECHDQDPAACAIAVKEALQLGSYPLAPIFAPYGGVPATRGMFALSWLDTRRLPVELDRSFQIQYVSASLLVDGVMIWFIVNGEGLHIRCRYPDTPQARQNVGAWLDEIDVALQTTAGIDTVVPVPHP